MKSHTLGRTHTHTYTQNWRTAVASLIRAVALERSVDVCIIKAIKRIYKLIRRVAFAVSPPIENIVHMCNINTVTGGAEGLPI